MNGRRVRNFAGSWVLAASLLLNAGANVMAQEQMLYDFDDPRTASGWIAINDNVMGGVSAGGMSGAADGTAVFAGSLSLENNGGFASLRSQPRRWQLDGYTGIEMRVRGDGRRYQLRLKNDPHFDGVAYRAFFETTTEEWQTIRVPFSWFEASFRGRRVAEAPTLDPASIESMGFLIADKQAGPFRLEIDWIGAYRD